MQTMDLMPDSDGEIGSEVLNSSQSSMSSRDGSCEDVRCSSFSRLSFDAAAAVPALEQPNDRGLPAGSPVGVPSKPCLSSDLAFGSRSRSGAGRMPPNAGHRDFKLIRRIGSGDIGTVYLCRLREESSGACVPGASEYVYAMKIVDKRALAVKKKLERAATEKRILRALNHPFLPTLYADFDAAPHYSCVVMEYCGGGDLHTLRHRQPGGRFSVAATRFYAAEVLLALEYLHMLGVVYRDLKPENILIRSDGHIMLSDFDLSLESTSTPTVEHVNLSPSNPDSGASTGYVGCTSGDPSCLPAFRARRPSAVPSRLFVAEPVAARSCSFVGTHEYVAPEVAAGRTHGSAVDWWAYGVLLYELLYGRTPFAGPTNEATLRNIIRQPLAFPPPTSSAGGGSCSPDSAARDLIAGLLVKDPAARLGSSRGSADVKGHRFFKGLNFALMRSSRPPFVPGRVRSASRADASKLTPVEFF